MYSATFRLISPLRVHCLLQPGVEFREERRTYDFWQGVAKKVGATLTRQSPDDDGLRYQSTHSIDLGNDIAVLTCDTIPDADEVSPMDEGIVVEEVRWSLCDFGILLVETTLRVTVDSRSADEIEMAVQRAATAVNTSFIEDSYGKLCEAIARQEGHEEFVVFDSGPRIEHEWASRALIFDPNLVDYAEEQRVFARAWLANRPCSGQIVEKIERGEQTHSADWMNYVYLKEDPTSATTSKEMWKALLRAQFYYAAMGRIDSKLMEILAWAMSQSPDVSTSKLREQLRHEMDFAEALFLKKSEIGKYVNPSSRVETERILEVWDFDDVLANPVRMKLTICQTRLDSLESERARAASFFTDLILMVIGVTSILGTALAVVSLGRSASADPDQTVYDLGAGELTTWIATQPIDVILLISTIISVLMVAVFVVARKRSEV